MSKQGLVMRAIALGKTCISAIDFVIHKHFTYAPNTLISIFVDSRTTLLFA